MMSDQTGRPSPASIPLPTEENGPKLKVLGRTGGVLRLKVTVPGFENRFELSRGPDVRPLQFEGDVLAEVERGSNQRGIRERNIFDPDVYRAALYKTRGGKFITEFSTLRGDERDGKAEVFESLDAACEWFRPGPLTTELLKKLGRWQPEIIE